MWIKFYPALPLTALWEKNNTDADLSLFLQGLPTCGVCGLVFSTLVSGKMRRRRLTFFFRFELAEQSFPKSFSLFRKSWNVISRSALRGERLTVSESNRQMVFAEGFCFFENSLKNTSFSESKLHQQRLNNMNNKKATVISHL